MTTEQLSSRKNTILRTVVETHIETSQPVGSKYIAEKYAFSFSPATVRNDMCELEERGYLTHPHTSSGRIPTDHGYRYYLDHMPFEQILPAGYFDKAAQELAPAPGEGGVEDLLDRVSLMLSAMSQEVGLTLLPFPGSRSSERPERLKLSLQGLAHILEKPEFQDVRKARCLLGAMEEKITLMNWVLRHANAEHVSVSVGHEHEHEALEDCAIVTARYHAGEGRQGVIAIVGPKRMAYRQIVPLVSRMAVAVGDVLEHRESEDR